MNQTFVLYVDFGFLSCLGLCSLRVSLLRYMQVLCWPRAQTLAPPTTAALGTYSNLISCHDHLGDTNVKTAPFQSRMFESLTDLEPREEASS